MQCLPLLPALCCLMPVQESHWYVGHEIQAGRCLSCPPGPQGCPFQAGQVPCSRSTSCKGFLTLTSGKAAQPSQPAVCSHCPAIPGSQGYRLGSSHLLNHLIFIFRRLIFEEKTFVGFFGFSYGGLMYFSLEKGLEKAFSGSWSPAINLRKLCSMTGVVRPLLKHCMPGVGKGDVSYQDGVGYCCVTMLSPSMAS